MNEVNRRSGLSQAEPYEFKERDIPCNGVYFVHHFGNSKLQSDLSEGDFCDALKLIVLSRGGSDNVKIFNKG